jgi:hypothetical protein
MNIVREGAFRIMAQARVAELVDAHDSKSCSARSGGSIPSTGTILKSILILLRFFQSPTAQKLLTAT